MANKTLIIKMDPSATFTGGSTASSGIATYNNKIITGVGAGSTNLTLNFASSKISSRTFNKVFNINVKNKYEAAKSELQSLFNEYNSMELYLAFHVYKTTGGSGSTPVNVNKYQPLNQSATTYYVSYHVNVNSGNVNSKSYITLESGTATTTSWFQTAYAKTIDDTNKTMTFDSSAVSASGTYKVRIDLYSETTGSVWQTSTYKAVTGNFTISLQCVVDYLNFKISSSEMSTGQLGSNSNNIALITLECTNYRFKNASGYILTTDDIQTILDKYK